MTVSFPEDLPTAVSERPQDSLLEVGNTLITCIEFLDTFMAVTEDEFLNTGTKLRDFHSRSLRIAEGSAFISETISGDRIWQAIEALNALMQKMALYLRRSENVTMESMVRLGGIVSTVDDVHLHLEELEQIARTLRVLGLSTALQSAALRRTGSEGAVLGSDIKTLSFVVQEKSQNIGSNVAALITFIQTTLARLKLLEESQQKKAAVVLKATMAGINALIAKHRLATTTSRDISAAAENISQSIGNVVASQQFHDITRQQFEAIRNAFATMSAALLAHPGLRNELPGAPGSGKDRMREAARLCFSEAAALSETRRTFITAVETIIGNLKTIAAAVRDMNRKTDLLTGRDSSSGSFLAGLGGTLSSVMSTLATLSEDITTKKELAEAVTYIWRTTTEMAGFIREIEDIGDEVDLIAFNAAVKASMLGEEGKPLVVIAEWIQRVSFETQKHTNAVSEMLNSVTRYTAELSGKIDESFTSGGTEVKEMSGTLQSQVGLLSKANRDIQKANTEIESFSSTLAEDIESAADKITVYTLVDSSVTRIISLLEANLARIRMAVPEITQEAYGGGDAVTPLQGEGDLRAEGPGAPATESAQETDKEFGENIELF
ncbi:MAG: methyl-accepting chemotaxis protein [Thermodesulfovibrionales bacterium]